MAALLSTDLASQLQGAPTQQIAQQLGIDPAQASSAITAALPLLLGALGRNASQQQGAQSLYNALQNDHSGPDNSVLDIGSVLGSVLGRWWTRRADSRPCLWRSPAARNTGSWTIHRQRQRQRQRQREHAVALAGTDRDGISSQAGIRSPASFSGHPARQRGDEQHRVDQPGKHELIDERGRRHHTHHGLTLWRRRSSERCAGPGGCARATH